MRSMILLGADVGFGVSYSFQNEDTSIVTHIAIGTSDKDFRENPTYT